MNNFISSLDLDEIISYYDLNQSTTSKNYYSNLCSVLNIYTKTNNGANQNLNMYNKQ